MSGPIIEEIQDDMKQLELTSSDKRKINAGLNKLDDEVSSLVRNLQNDKLTEKQANLLMAAVNAKRFISSEKADGFLDDYQKQLMKLEPQDRIGFLIIYDALASMRNEVLAIESSKKHELQLAAYKAGKNPLAIDEMKVAASLQGKTFVQNIAASAGVSSLIAYGLHKGTTSISLFAEGLKTAGTNLANYQACSASTDASWLSYENLTCGVAKKILEPIAASSGALVSSIGSISADLREGGIILLGLVLFLGILVFMIFGRKIQSTKKLKVAFLGEVEFSFSGNKKMRKSLRKKFIRKSKKTRK